MTTDIFAPVEGRLVVDVWSDVVCPFCYMGDALLGQAIERFPHGGDIEIRYHSYQLMPELPADSAMNLDELLEREKGIPRRQAAAMNAQVSARAAELGLEYNLDRAIGTNTRTAHRLIKFAGAQGHQHAMVQRLFRGYFTEGLNVGDHQVLAGLAAEVGLDQEQALEALRSDAYAAEVDADIRTANELGINGVPFFVLDGRYGVSGAQPLATFSGALEQAWNEKAAGAA